MGAKSAKARKASRQQSAAQDAAQQPLVAMKVGDWQFPQFDGVSAVFGASHGDYPPLDMIPPQFLQHHNKHVRIASSLFFSGGKLADHGVEFAPGIDHRSAMTAIRSLLCSFAPKHEIKEATVGWALSEWTQPIA